MMERKKAKEYEANLKLLQSALSAQVEGVQTHILKVDERTRLRLSPMIEGLGVKHRELGSMIAQLPQVADEDLDHHMRHTERLLLDMLLLLNLVMADLLNFPKR
jgi:hypothetical protein